MAEIYLVIPKYSPGGWGTDDFGFFDEYSNFADALLKAQEVAQEYGETGVFQLTATAGPEEKER